jgi:hypothetical protein
LVSLGAPLFHARLRIATSPPRCFHQRGGVMRPLFEGRRSDDPS